MTDMWAIKNNPLGIKKCSNFYFYCFSLDFLIRNQNIISEEWKQKNVWNNFEWVTSPQSWGVNPIHAGGRADSVPLRFFLQNSKTEKKLSDFNFTLLTDILRILSITIVARCCHSNLLFPVCHVIFWLKKHRNLNHFQDNYLIKPKFGTGTTFRPWIQIHEKF